MTRPYELNSRAQKQKATRQRIVEATVAFHEEIGGEATTINAIAERAGVSRLTVYRHFPDERSLLSACTGHYFAQNPPPDPATWASIDDPGMQLRTALNSTYAFYRRTQTMQARAQQETPTNPVLAELMAPVIAFWDQVRDDLAIGWTTDIDPDLARCVIAAIGHGLAFTSWRSLTMEQGLDDDQVTEMMVHLVRVTARSTETASPR